MIDEKDKRNVYKAIQRCGSTEAHTGWKRILEEIEQLKKQLNRRGDYCDDCEGYDLCKMCLDHAE